MEPNRSRKTPQPAPKKKRKKYGWCRQCGERFEKKRDWQDFCKEEHRKAFHHHGGPSFAKFQTLMETAIKKSERRIVQAVTKQLRAILKPLIGDEKARQTAEHLRAGMYAQLETEGKEEDYGQQ